MEFLNGISVEVSGHKLESSQTPSFCLVFYPHFSILHKMLFTNRLEFSCFTDFLSDF